MSITRILCPVCGFPQAFCACGKSGSPGVLASPEPAGHLPVVDAVAGGCLAGEIKFTDRQINNALAICRNSARLEKLTPQELIAETLKSDAADYAVVVELMNRVLPGWYNLPDGTFDQPDNSKV